jgi:hypothetical protein
MPQKTKATKATVYTADEIAKTNKLNPSTVRKLFMYEPGVLRIGRGRRRSLRIPHEVAERVLSRMTVKAPREVELAEAR